MSKSLARASGAEAAVGDRSEAAPAIAPAGGEEHQSVLNLREKAMIGSTLAAGAALYALLVYSLV
ncbi:MAG TPA: hypothetical protein VGW34_12300 [Allosphingosinicella sp.]|nr:hypothetical protein [Allosphingosinicella sp.]